MIRYALKCSNGHHFESWFASSSAYDGLRDSGHLACPECGDAAIEKALMAPRLAQSEEGRALPATATDTEGEAPSGMALSPAGDPRAAALARLREEVERNSDYVGPRFVDEARRIHSGDAPERPIHGEAKPAEARALLEDGIPVMPLPFLPRRKAN